MTADFNLPINLVVDTEPSVNATIDGELDVDVFTPLGSAISKNFQTVPYTSGNLVSLL